MSDSQSKPLRVVLYARVSTEEQREGQTIQSQIDELQRFASASGWTISKVYQDEGWSGSMLARPQLDSLRDDAAAGLFEAVLLNDVDRLARDVTHLGIIKRDLERHRVQVIFRKLPNENSPTHNLMVNILGSFAEFEREMIADRTRRGRRHKVEIRKQYLGSHPPYGYRYIPINKQDRQNGYLEVHPEEAAVVREMFWQVGSNGFSARRLLGHLNEKGLKGRKGGPWQKSSVLRILRSETYAGTWHFYKLESCEPAKSLTTSKYRKRAKSSTRLRPKAEWLPIVLPEHLRIVDRDLWNEVQHRLDQNITFSPRNSKHNYLLRGLIRCGACGACYVGDPNHGFFYYRCIKRCKRLPTVREDALNAIVWDSVVKAFLQPDVIADHAISKNTPSAKSTDAIHNEGESIAAGLRQLQTEESRLLEAYRLEVISAAQLQQELDKLKPRKELLLAQQEQSSQRPIESTVIKRTIEEYCRLVSANLRAYTFEQKQEFLRTVIRTITFNGDSIRIRGIIPVKANEMKSSGSELASPHAATGIEAPSIERYARNPSAVVRDIAAMSIKRCARNPDRVEVDWQLDAAVPAFISDWWLYQPRGPLGRFVSKVA